MNPRPKPTTLQQLNAALANRSLSSPQPHNSVIEEVNEGLEELGQPAITLGQYIIGVEQIHGKTTSILRSQVATTRDQETAVEIAMKVAQEGKKGRVPFIQRRWSVDCSTYSWGERANRK